jgi:hypothetical protein
MHGYSEDRIGAERFEFDHDEAGPAGAGVDEGGRVSVPDKVQALLPADLNAAVGNGSERVLVGDDELGAAVRRGHAPIRRRHSDRALEDPE